MIRYRTGLPSEGSRTEHSESFMLRGRRFLQALSCGQIFALSLAAFGFLVLGIRVDRLWIGWEDGQSASVTFRSTPTSAFSNALPSFPTPPASRPITSSIAGQTTTPSSGTVRYLIQPGDNLISISARYHVSVEALRDANSISGDLIVAGEYLLIPSGSSGTK